MFFAVLFDVLGASAKLRPVAAILSSHHRCSRDYRRKVECGAFRCIDGLTNDTEENQCRTYWDFTPWLALDFGEEAQVSVEKTVLFTSVFNDKYSDWNRTRNIEVWLADEIPTTAAEKFSEGHQLATFEGSATSGKEVEIQSGPGWNKKMGRYLIIQMYNRTEDVTANLRLNLKEVFTFGTTHAPPNGMFCFAVFIDN